VESSRGCCFVWIGFRCTFSATENSLDASGNHRNPRSYARSMFEKKGEIFFS
jgi:hypothetical protein